MLPSAALEAHLDDVRRIVAANRATNPRVFGSASRGEDRAGSDLDLLIDPQPGMTLFDLGRIRHELKSLLGVSVDVLTPGALPESFHDRVLAEARPL